MITRRTPPPAARPAPPLIRPPSSLLSSSTRFAKPMLRRKRSAIALVVVLTFIALIAALTVIFLRRAGTERAAAASYKAAAGTRQLADSAVNLVQAQINLAATEGANIAWASQPGMIRTFNPSGSLKTSYKLFSAGDMVDGAVNLTADLPPAEWASRQAEWSDLNEPLPDASKTLVYPIVDPAAAGEIPGFAITSAPGATPAQPAPMPVRWLYALRDGQLVLPTSGGDGLSLTVPGATPDNPIVGRIAFWTDDETAKVNINTASEGTHWDTPRVSTEEDKRFGMYQPAQREWQAYPGHPATTSLSAVFPSLSRNDIFKLVPRINGGGSQGGTARATAPITADTNRLYASVDEFLFAPDRGQNSPLTKDQLKRAQFFLTASSRAPETNLFNQPRVAIWPVHANDSSSNRTAFDKLIARCASAGGFPYYFQRRSSQSPDSDITIPRNLLLYSYLQRLMSSPVPGFGGSFSGKYGADANQILTEIFDYIRSTNLIDYQFKDTGQTFTPWVSFSPGHGQVAPTRHPNGTQGFGRFHTVSEAALHFIATADASVALSNDKDTNLTLGGTPLSANQKRIEAIFLLELFSPSHGFTAINPSMRIGVRGLDSFQINNTPLQFPNEGTIDMTRSPATLSGQGTLGGTINFRYPLLYRHVPSEPARPGTEPYPFVSLPITIADAPTMAFNGGTIFVDIFAGTGSSAPLVQTITIEFPPATFPAPTLVERTINDGTGNHQQEKWWSFSAQGATGTGGRLGRIEGYNQFVLTEDVVKSVVVASGDTRLAAARQTAPASLFAPHRWYLDAATPHAHQLLDPGRGAVNPDTAGKLVPAATYNGLSIVDVPSGVLSANDTGDWDNGVAYLRDGAYINKPDEGEVVNASPYDAYFNGSDTDTDTTSPNFSPNRIVASSAMFGSLPTGVMSGQAWRTLLFRPQPGHPGELSPKDSLLLDLFWMPVVEPYAISDPFSTAGKINLNYQIMPFTYLTRETGLRAVLKNEKALAVPTSASNYKNNGGAITVSNNAWRRAIDIPYVLEQCDAKFGAGEIFRSASEICDINLLNLAWNGYALTGDNSRERPYATIYPRLTTKSNSYTVHFRAQSLKQTRQAAPDSWNEGRDAVVGEYRGATTLERYLDPNTPGLPDYATDADAPTLDTFYRWRIVRNTQFAP